MAASTTASSADDISNFDTGLGGVDQVQNFLFRDVLWWSLGIVALSILCLRFFEIALAHIRHVSAMALPASAQAYWRSAQWGYMPWIKKHLTYAPISRKRHNREIQISSALSIGTLPTRLQAILLVGYLGSNLAYMLVLDYGRENRWSLWAEVRGRSGTLAAVNMVPLVLLASRNNPLISMLRISFDTFNIVHRWVGRTVAIETIIHTIAWMVVQVNDGGWPSVSFKIIHDSFIASGTVGVVALTVLVVVSVSPLRHAFYETFLATHILLAIIILACTWIHCATASIAGGLPELPYVVAIIILWVVERLARVALSAYSSWSRHGWADAVVEALPGETCRVTVHLPRYVNVRPGTHAYLRFLNIAPWQCHPFSIAWVKHNPRFDNDDILPVSVKEAQSEQQIFMEASVDGHNKKTHLLRTSVSFIISAQHGFTRKLYDRAREQGQQAITLKALFEGPYAGHHSLDSYGHVVLVAGASGITHQISYLRHLIEGYAAGTVATRRISFIWVVRDQEAFEWIRPWMDEILRLPHRAEVLHIRLFVTRPKHALKMYPASRSVQVFPSRPNISTLLKKEVAEQKGAMCVTVCGSGAMADDVRAAVRDVLDEGTVVDFVEESFTW
ncbi:ferric reductase-like protein [Grosmannia clavigera kw1407]|uniref:Ferric reductase-like protein n=1 Tax=Grosmannia clavigera (strain kw1407 / UAMH 11150) TaxID=655863 RepID=F0XGD9_GROCL|nr:ferric reductase-like protein [Grosmannia clavigera kw1407]EFX03008.1 ferric reductase-like protein [Grosmannia clavigera kw1407]